MLDEMDVHILDLLQTETRLSNLELSQRVNLSAPATHARVKRLEQDGYIDSYTAILNQEKLGYELLCTVFMSTSIHQTQELNELERHLSAMPEVMECYCMTGAFDYMLKTIHRSRKELEAFIRELNQLGVSQLQTSIVLREVKASTVLPLRK